MYISREKENMKDDFCGKFVWGQELLSEDLLGHFFLLFIFSNENFIFIYLGYIGASPVFYAY